MLIAQNDLVKKGKGSLVSSEVESKKRSRAKEFLQ